ncbi:unnamed protein product [Rangifer tarandus platyrhynchus]|uniref:Uncharacterized protein n=2 Tax=Rangifer tarandus platyrhynchus TaxID=3082113 RepID=A0ABN8YBS4_RANTA|nr:unnamed protein product [Rangifer tarandus platyrhynchus]CAI9696267.1 unnamed protein product [Rangifer tarandus platyrhynchus]
MAERLCLGLQHLVETGFSVFSRNVCFCQCTHVSKALVPSTRRQNVTCKDALSPDGAAEGQAGRGSSESPVASGGPGTAPGPAGRLKLVQFEVQSPSMVP